jgi:hypothetical protein
MAQTQRTELFIQIKTLIEEDDGSLLGLEPLVEKILTVVHQHYRAQQHDFVIDIHQSPFADEVLSQIVALTYRDLLRAFSMAELSAQEIATLDFTADPLTELSLGFSKATCQLLVSMWETFTDKIARTQAKAEKDLAKALQSPLTETQEE